MKSKREKIELKDEKTLPKSITLTTETVTLFGKPSVRHYPATTFDKLWLMVQLPNLFSEKDYLTGGEAERVIPMLSERNVVVTVK